MSAQAASKPSREILTLEVAELAPGSPFGPACPWADPPITLEEVRAAIARGKFEIESFQVAGPLVPRGWHAARIAYLVVHPDPTPVEVFRNTRWGLNGPPSDGPRYELDEGFHRLGAAIFRGDETIEAEVMG